MIAHVGEWVVIVGVIQQGPEEVPEAPDGPMAWFLLQHLSETGDAECFMVRLWGDDATRLVAERRAGDAVMVQGWQMSALGFIDAACVSSGGDRNEMREGERWVLAGSGRCSRGSHRGINKRNKCNSTDGD